MTIDDAETGSPIDAEAQRLAEAGDLAGAATLLIQTYGPGVIGWLKALTGTPEEADEVFAVVCERLWKALPNFTWPGKPRTWFYVVGRNALIDRRRKPGREVPLSASPPIAAAVRSTTAAYRKTDSKNRLAELRAALDPEDRNLLILRIDRGMSWKEIAEVLAGGPTSDDETRRTSARVRKQFERIKTRLRAQWDVSGDG